MQSSDRLRSASVERVETSSEDKVWLGQTELRDSADELAVQVDRLQQLSEATLAIYDAKGVREILEVATESAVRIVGARIGRATIREQQSSGEPATQLVAIGEPECFTNRELLASIDSHCSPIRVSKGEESALQLAFPDLSGHEQEIASQGWIAVPFTELRGGASGVIHLFQKSNGDFTDADVTILSRISQVACSAIEKAWEFDELRASESRYRQLFDSHLSGDFITAVDGTFLEVNPTFARILGHSSVEALDGMKDSSFYRDPGERERLVRRVERGSGVVQDETEFVRADGVTIAVIIHMAGVYDSAGELIALQGCLFDISHWKHAHTALRESQQQLLQAQKMEAVGQLAGGIAHDFNNMLMAIEGYAALLEEEIPAGTTARAHLTEIRNAARRSGQLTRQLLAYSRKQVLQPEVLDLNSAVNGIKDMLERLIGEHIEFVTETDPDAGCVHADPGQLQQVVMNLVLNARDAMPRGGRLIVRTGACSIGSPRDFSAFTLPPGSYTTLTVVDTGCGIPPEIIPRIYEPFFTTKPIGGGSGLGLSTAYGIVKQSGGYIEAESQRGAGTTFTIYLPRTNATPGQLDASAFLTEQEDKAATILIAEDEPVLRSLTAMILKRSGYRVLEAEDGIEALRIASEHEFAIDLLLTDLVMPRRGGQLLAAQLLDNNPDMKVIFMSGYAEEVVTRQGLIFAGTAFLEKPFTPQVLGRTVREMLAPELTVSG